MEHRHLPYTIDPAKNRQHYYETHWKRVSLQLLARHLPPTGQTILDYGCGRGEALEIARHFGYSPRGTDADPECVRLASKYGACELLNMGDPLTQFGAKSFDIVCCFHVLEHVECPKAVLNTLGQIAKKYVLLAVPNLRQLHGLLSRNIDLSHVNEGHLQAWDHWHLLNLAERHCGLKFVEWAFDTTQMPLLTNIAQRAFGNNAAIWLETGPFLKLFPYHCRSIIGLFSIK
jgi:SAM-dependent methyltransferase